MKIAKFADFTGEIDSIYTGHESGCRCGCLGRYFEPGSVGFTRALNKITKINPDVQYVSEGDTGNKINAALARIEPGTAISDGEEWIDLCLPNDRTITVYYKKNTITIKNV